MEICIATAFTMSKNRVMNRFIFFIIVVLVEKDWLRISSRLLPFSLQDSAAFSVYKSV
jgi:hypothetical protein